MTKSILEQLDEAEKAATQGPWQAYGATDSPKGRYLSGVKTLAQVPYDENIVVPYRDYEESGTTEAELIALMRNNIRALIDVAKTLEYYANEQRYIDETAYLLSEDRGRKARLALAKLKEPAE